MRVGATGGAFAFAMTCAVIGGEVNTSTLSENGWFSDDTCADGSGSEPAGTNLVSDTPTDDPEGTGSGTASSTGIPE
jgi:hypothetical protein